VGDIRYGVSTSCRAVPACYRGMCGKRIAIVSRDHSDARRQAGVLVLHDIEDLWFAVILHGGIHKVEGIVSWPCHLRWIEIRRGEEWLLVVDVVVGLIALSVGVGHPTVVRLHVMELRRRSRPLELMLRAWWRRVG